MKPAAGATILASDESDEETTGVDAKTPSDVIGDWGPMQRRILIFLTLCDLIAPFNNSGIIFYLLKPTFYCNVYNETSGSLDVYANTCMIPGSQAACTNLTYDHDVYKRTMVETFDLVCDRQWYGSFAQSMKQVGTVASGYLIGALSDNYGRVKAARYSMALEIVAGFGQAFAPNMVFFCAARFLSGFAGNGRYLTGYVLVNEWMGPKARSRSAIVYVFGSNIGCILLPLAFYFYSDFRVIQSAVSIFEMLMLVMYIFVVWESPRWLLTHHEYDEAAACLRNAARLKKELSEQEVEQRIKSLRHNSEASATSNGTREPCIGGLIQLMKASKYRLVTLILFYTWMVQTFIGSASSFNISSLGDNIFLSFLIDSISSSITNSMLLLMINQVSRKSFLKATMLTEVIGLLALMGCSFHPDLYYWRLACYLVFNSGRSAAGKVSQLYTTETYPTTVRQSAIGICSLFGNMASTIAPFVRELNAVTHAAVVLLIYIATAFVNLILILFVPETHNTELPDIVPEREKRTEEEKT